MKPNRQHAMLALVNDIRLRIPFNTPIEALCNGTCRGCSKKLLEHLEMELVNWEDDAQSATFGDIQKLAKMSKKIATALERNGITVQQ